MPASAPTLAQLALEYALTEAKEGVFEDPPQSNRGPRIDEYQTGRGALGQAWCLKFVHWCYSQASTRLGVTNPLPKVFLVRAFMDWARKDGKVVTDPQPGDIIVKRPDKHVGLLYTLPVGERFSSVEGNTFTSDRKKEGVYVVRRLLTINYEFVRVAA